MGLEHALARGLIAAVRGTCDVIVACHALPWKTKAVFASFGAVTLVTVVAIDADATRVPPVPRSSLEPARPAVFLIIGKRHGIDDRGLAGPTPTGLSRVCARDIDTTVLKDQRKRQRSPFHIAADRTHFGNRRPLAIGFRKGANVDPVETRRIASLGRQSNLAWPGVGSGALRKGVFLRTLRGKLFLATGSPINRHTKADRDRPDQGFRIDEHHDLGACLGLGAPRHQAETQDTSKTRVFGPNSHSLPRRVNVIPLWPSRSGSVFFLPLTATAVPAMAPTTTTPVIVQNHHVVNTLFFFGDSSLPGGA